MSYSVYSKCDNCKERAKCNDLDIIRGAVSTIHSLYPGQERGHLGAGTVTIECNNFDDKNQPEIADEFHH
ncbi:MAG TPA: hypothetical protein VGK71_05935 [Nitrospirota bacterium]|jgi:hypothetical protein